MTNQADFKDKRGRWVQRSWNNGKYTWTDSGVLWNGVKERTTRTGTKYSRNNAYLNSVNAFSGFQAFTDWHIEQVGYGMGYQLDADILMVGVKTYSESTCLLVPPALNKFLQSYEYSRGCWPQGMCLVKGNLQVVIINMGIKQHLGSFPISDITEARRVYSVAKNKAGSDWYKALVEGKYEVDARVVEYMRNWRYVCDWKPNGQV